MSFVIATGVLRVTADTTRAIGGLTALTGAASAAGAAIAALPALGASAAGIGGVLAGSFAGVGDALKGYTADQKAASAQAGKSAAQEAAAARQIRDAKRSIVDAQRNQTRVAQESARAINKAMDDQADTARRGADTISKAQRNVAEVAEEGAQRIASASRRVEDALENETRAQEGLSDARADAARQLEDLREKVDDYGLSQEGAAIRVAEAEAELAEVNADASATAMDRRKAEYELAVAKERVSDLTREQAEATAALTVADARGIEGSDKVVDAQRKVADAHQATQEAQANLAQVQRDAAQANVDAAQKVAEAQRSAAEANAEAAARTAEVRMQAAQSEQDAARAVADAVQGLADAQASQAASATSGAAATSQYAEAMAKLSPAARLLVEQLNSMRPLVKGLSDTSAAAFLPGVTQMLRDSEGLFPIFQGYLRDTGTIMGDTARDFGSLFKSSEFQTNLQKMFDASLPITQAILNGILTVYDAWVRLGGNSGPVAEGFSRGLTAVFEGLASFMDNLAPHMDAFGIIIETLFTVLGGLLGPLATVLGVLAEALIFLEPVLGPVVAGLLGMLAAAKVVQVIFGLVQAWMLVQALFAITPFGVIMIAIAGLVAALIYMWNTSETFRNIVKGAFEAVATAGRWLWENALKPVFEALKVGLRWVGDAAVWLYTNAIKPAWDAISSAIRFAYNNVIKPLFDANVAYIRLLGSIAMWLYTNAIKPAWDGIVGAISWAWNNMIRPLFGGFEAGMRAVAAVAQWLYSNVIRPVWDAIVGAIRAAWNNGIRPILDFLRGGVDAVGRTFQNVADWIARSWDSIREAARRPVQWVVDVVYNNGIRRIWNGVASVFGMGQLGEVRMARGGLVPGVDTGFDYVPALLRGGEGVLVPEAVRALGGSRGIEMLNRGAERKHFAEGGTVGSVQNDPSFWDKLFGGPANWVRGAFGSVFNGLNAMPGAGMLRDAMMNFPRKAVDGIIAKVSEWVSSSASSVGPNAGGSGVERWRGVVMQALAMMGQPASMAGSTLRRMNQESGGNPSIVNKWDINWLRGTPSVGLMQVIGPTYRANADRRRNVGPYVYGTSIDPLSNVLASMHYALGRYGSLPRAYDRPGGYDAGGWLPTGHSSVFNGTGRPEAVLTAGQWSTAKAAVESRMGPNQQTVNVHVTQVSGSPAETGRMVALALRTIG